MAAPSKIALWASSSLRLLCKLRARVSLYPGAIGRATNERARKIFGKTPEVSPKETEP
ncbi:hypothetical protein T261_5449 [Streptomyces lydicus]|nr:hypothetical protein T261_5449 [Streptomyces lydicus]